MCVRANVCISVIRRVIEIKEQNYNFESDRNYADYIRYISNIPVLFFSPY